MTDIPQTAEEFDLFRERHVNLWPNSLWRLSRAAALTMRSLNQANAAKSHAFMEASRKDLQAFAEAYTAWRSTKERRST
jgi:hypothetical protein